MMPTNFMMSLNDEWKSIIIKNIKAETEAQKLAFYEQNLIKHPEPEIEIQPFYTHEDIKGLEYLKEFHQVWTETKQTVGWMNIENINVSDEQETNQKIKEVLKKGVDGVLLSSFSQPDFEKLLKDISLRQVPVYFDIPIEYFESLKAYLKKNETDISITMGGIRPTDFVLPESPTNVDFAFELSTFFKDSLFFSPLIIPAFGLKYEPVLSATEELLACLKYAVELVEALKERGLQTSVVLKQIGFEIGIGTDYFRNIAKLRALRWLWWQIGKTYNSNLNLIDVFIMAFTKPEENLAKEPYKNMIANTTKAMSAITGGCDALEVTATEIGLPEYSKDFSGRIARNVSVILKEESYFTQFTDASSGSYFIENLTHQLNKAVWEKL